MSAQILIASLNDGIKAALPFAGLSLATIYAVGFLQAAILENRIRKLYKERDGKIANERGRAVVQDYIDRMTEKHTRDYGEKIEILERERRFILDKIPLLKQ